MLEKIKTALRIEGTDLDIEINDLIEAAKIDLKLSGVAESKIVDTDPFVLRAITVYCQANYAFDEREAERYQRSYDMIKTHMALSADYNTAGGTNEDQTTQA